jgi:NSS family neurotransmitter:Na+ symporter
VTDISKEEAKEQHWNSRATFLLAAIASAVGLGNVWRFPYIAANNGGGAFLIAYFVALFTAGIPLLILEFSLGHMSRGAPPTAFAKVVGKKWEWAGWFTVFAPFLVAAYYTVVIAWCFCYMIYSLGIRWGANAEGFFLNNFLGLTSGPEILGGIRIPVLIALVMLWFLIFLILYKGVERIGKVCTVLVPVSTIFLAIMVFRGLTLPGAMEGVSYYLTPNFSALLTYEVWLAAYAQVFFSLSLAQGIMITYAAFLPKKSDLTNNAFITALADSGTSFFAAFAVFSIVGYLSFSSGTSIENLGIAGPQLAFVTYPTGISLLPFAAAAFGIIFYIALQMVGITSAFSMVAPISSSVNMKWGMSKTKATAIVCIIGFFASLIFATGSGMYWLQILDHFVADFALVIIGLMECLILGYVYKLYRLRQHANDVSDFRIGRWWDVLIKFVTPGILIFILIVAFYENIRAPYMGFPVWAILVGGVIPVIAIILLSFVFMKIKGKEVEV